MNSRTFSKIDLYHGISVSGASSRARWSSAVTVAVTLATGIAMRLRNAARALFAFTVRSSAGDDNSESHTLTRWCVATARSKAARHRAQETRWLSTIRRSGVGPDS